jgi:hypothetical protein
MAAVRAFDDFDDGDPSGNDAIGDFEIAVQPRRAE